MTWAAALTLAVLPAPAAATPPSPAPPSIGGRVGDHGARVEGEAGRPGHTWESGGAGERAGHAGAPTWTQAPTYTAIKYVVKCGGNGGPNLGPGDDTCRLAFALCRGQSPTPVPMTDVWGLDTAGAWQHLGATCFPDEIVAAQAKPVLTEADIVREFENTPFATPVASSEPVANRTLVDLPVYFQLAWPAAGYGPGSVRSVSLLGHTVELTVRLLDYTYDFGDGATSGATTSVGGHYPVGDVTHAYAVQGRYSPAVTIVLTADYRVDGGPPAPLPGRATRHADFAPVTVETASDRLLDR